MKKTIIIISILIALLIAFSFGKCSSSNTDDSASQTNTEHVDSGMELATEYTCSMHPQVRTPDKKAKCPICFMDLIPVPLGASDVPPNAISMSESAMKRAQIEVAPVISGHPRRVIQLVGTIETNETKLSTISAWFPGRVEHLYVNFTGATVTAGDKLADLYSPELLVAQGELQVAAQSAKRIKGNSIVARTAKETYKAARRKLERWGLTEEQIDRLVDDQSISDEITITSPIDGVVLTRSIAVGEYVTTGQTMFQIADLETVWVLLEAHETDLPFLSVGQEINIETDVLPGQTFSSKIEFIDPVLNPKTRTATVRLAIENSSSQLLPGSFVRGEVVGNHDTPTLLVPRSAVLQTGRRAVVFVQIPAEEPTFEARVIKLGEQGNEMYAVKEGLEEGELVVIEGTFKIDSELQIQAKPSMMGLQNETKQHRVSENFLMSLTPVYSNYFSAQKALADDDLKTFLLAQEDLAIMLTIVDDSLLLGKTLNDWRSIQKSLEKTTIKSPDIENARITFEDMSKAVLKLQKIFGHSGGTYYEMYCPMAFDFKGAYWLQNNDALVNPYFGASMLKCGETKNVFKQNGGDE